MALIPYLNKGDRVTAARWNTFYAEIDERLAKNFGNQSILLWGNGVDFGVSVEPSLYYARWFYFFPPIPNRSPARTTLSPSSTISSSFSLWKSWP